MSVILGIIGEKKRIANRKILDLSLAKALSENLCLISPKASS